MNTEAESSDKSPFPFYVNNMWALLQFPVIFSA